MFRCSNHEITCINKEAVIETLGLQHHGCQQYQGIGAPALGGRVGHSSS